jgi:hypothetical protein
MIFLVKRCLAEISGQQHSENGSFVPFYNTIMQPLNTKTTP